MGVILDSEKVGKVNRLKVEKEIMNFWNGVLGLVTFCSERHKIIK